MKSAKVEELFHYHPESHYLSQKDIADVDPSLKVVSGKLYNTLECQLVRIEDFFHECFFLTNLSLSSPTHLAHIRTNQLNFHSINTCLDLGVPIAADGICTTTNQFRMAVQFTFAPSPINSNLWKQFWELALAFVQQNIIYRIIYKKIPHKQLLHRIHPSQHLNGFCAICNDQPDSTAHFFTCPQSPVFWDKPIQEYLWPTKIVSITASIYSLNFSSLRPNTTYQETSSTAIIIIVLSEIWKAHWRYIFDSQPLSFWHYSYQHKVCYHQKNQQRFLF